MTVEARLCILIAESIKSCRTKGLLVADPIPPIELESPKVAEHGDLATNVAMVLARQEKKPSRTVAQAIVDLFPEAKELVSEIRIAGPGFINFVINPVAYLEVLKEVDECGPDYGHVNLGEGKRCQIEFVSANPTGPLHVGHGRGAVYGDVLGNVLAAAGYKVTKEYYVNDSGVQINTLGKSLYLRLEELRGRKNINQPHSGGEGGRARSSDGAPGRMTGRAPVIEFPADCYQGAYITDMARALLSGQDGLRLQAKGEEEQIRWCGEYAGKIILEEIKRDMAECGVTHDVYFFESELHNEHAVEKALELLRGNGKVYEQDGAVWFKSSDYGDDKDRVVRKSDGSYTYFAADIAYHLHKFRQGYARVVDIWGADHAGHVPRMKAAVEALGFDPDTLDCVLLQIVNLVREGKQVTMSTRRAEYETLRDLVREVGRDVCRYFFLMRSHNAQLDFDMKLATAQTMDNPVYYIQYAHARICSIFAKVSETGVTSDERRATSDAFLQLLDLPEEYQLAKLFGEYPKVITVAANELEPHRVTFYLLELARKFQAYYAMAKADPRYRVLGQPADVLHSKLYLLKCVRTVVQNALTLLGLSAPERMERLGED